MIIDEIHFCLNRENLRLKEEIEKLQKQLTYEQTKQVVKSPVIQNIPGIIN
jgi:cell division septum initiation protein DivIVA